MKFIIETLDKVNDSTYEVGPNELIRVTSLEPIHAFHFYVRSDEEIVVYVPKKEVSIFRR